MPPNDKKRWNPFSVLMIARHLDIGGTQTHVQVISKQLTKNGHKVIALTSGGGLVNDLEREGIEHHFLSFNLHVNRLKKLRINPTTIDQALDLGNIINIIFFPLCLFHAIRIAINNRITIIHAHSSLSAIIGMIPAKLLRIPLIITLHNSRGLSLRFSLLLKHVDKIIAVSQEIKEKITRLAISPHKVIVIPNMIEVDDTATSDIVLPHFHHNNSFTIVTVSRLDPVKIDMVRSLILCTERLIQDYPEKMIQVIIVGDGPELPKLRKMADRVNTQVGTQSIVFTGYRKDAIQIMSKGDIVIGSGRVVLEAMALGKPVIVASSRFGGILKQEALPQMAKYNFSGRNSREKSTSENIYHAIRTLIQDEQSRESAAKLSLETAKNIYSSEAVVNRIQEVYQQVRSPRYSWRDRQSFMQ